MRWLTAVVAVLAALVGGVAGAAFLLTTWETVGALAVGSTWSASALDLFDASVVWLWRARSVRIVLLFAVTCVVVVSGLLGAVLAIRRQPRAGRVLAIPVFAAVLLALPDPLMLECARVLVTVLAMAALVALLSGADRRPVWALLVFVALGVAVYGPDAFRGRLLDAVRAGDPSAVRRWIALGVEPGDVHPSPLALAVEAGDVEMAELLVRASADPYEGSAVIASPMTLSIERGSTAVTERMLATVLAMNEVRRRNREAE